MGEGLAIGWVAAEVGFSIDTIRYYERTGLMPLIPALPTVTAATPRKTWGG